MILTHVGEVAALTTAICWTMTAMAFESASRKAGSLIVNLVRIVLAFILLALFNYIRTGMLIPLNASAHNWTWLLLSGLVGFVIGDLFLFESYTIIGARISALIMIVVPILTALISWIILGETMSPASVLGMLLTISGIALVLFKRDINNNNKLTLTHSLRGIVFAFLGAVGQSGGLVLSKYGMKNYDPFLATQIRTISGIIGFTIIIVLLGKMNKVYDSVFNKPVMTRVLVGSFFGPFLGVSLSLMAVQHTNTAVASTIMSMVPIFIIPPSIMFLKQKITTRDIIGVTISIIGISLFFII